MGDGGGATSRKPLRAYTPEKPDFLVTLRNKGRLCDFPAKPASKASSEVDSA